MKVLDILPMLRMGDVINTFTPFRWYSPIAWLSLIIRWFQEYKYNHSMVFIEDATSSLIVESNEKGVNATIASKRLKGKYVKIYRRRDRFNYPAYKDRAMSLVGVSKYDETGLLLQAWRYMLRKLSRIFPFIKEHHPASSKHLNKTNEFICGAFSAWTHSMDKAQAWAPADFDRHPMFECVYEGYLE